MHSAFPTPLSAERSLKHFYRRFMKAHSLLCWQIQGLDDEVARQAYALLLLKRLLVLYFLQKQGLLAGDLHYLFNRFLAMRCQHEENRFYSCFLLPLCHQYLACQEPPSFCDSLFGTLPTFGLSLFAPHPLEQVPLSIPDSAFAQIFSFCETYHWHLDWRPTLGTELHPDVLAYICEQQFNSQQMGVYYTGDDVTTYIASNTIVPSLLTTFQQRDAALIPWYLLAADPDRYISSALRSPSFLPAETECEYQVRRTRYLHLHALLQSGAIHDVDSLVTYHLNIVQFARDTIQSCSYPSHLLAFYDSLEQITILDPTCGAGAFLLAALDILLTLYTTCFIRLRETTLSKSSSLNLPISPEILSCCQNLLAQARSPATCQRFLLTRILTANLYGVDLMEEAIQICRLRLYFSLLANISQPEDVLPLSALPLQIYIGNAVTGAIHAHDPAVCCTEAATASSRTGFAFHWCQHFPQVLARGGFDIIIGNPPYIEYSKVRGNYQAQGYELKSCGNLYAAVIERALALCRETSRLGLIVPLSICGSRRFASLRAALLDQLALLWLANFEIFPCRLFDGAFQRLSILLGCYQPDTSPTVYTTRLHRWYSVERSYVIDLINYTACALQVSGNLTFPKLASPSQEILWHKVLTRAGGQRLASVLTAHVTPHFVYYQEATNYWTKAVCHVPFYRKNGVIMPPQHGRFLYFANATTAQAVMALLNSSLFYLWFTTYSDGFHLSQALVAAFPFPRALLEHTDLSVLAVALEQDIHRHALPSTRNTHPNKDQVPLAIELQEFRMSFSKPLLDEIDHALAMFYGLTTEELDFITQYDVKYRMGLRQQRSGGL